MTITELEIFAFLASMGYNDYAICGIMGNLKQESNLRPNNLQNTHNKKLGLTDEEYTNLIDKGGGNFIHDNCGYGLAQWTFWSRKCDLLGYATFKNKSIGDLQSQLEFLDKEIHSYKSLYKRLKSCTNLKTATNLILTEYEKPSDQSEKALQQRLSFSNDFYDMFCPHYRIALAVRQGVYGNNPRRKKELIRLGLNYTKIQDIVNMIESEVKKDGSIIQRAVARTN